MICSKCQKRPAVVFVSSNKNDAEPRGYCLLCAQELGIKPVEDIIKKMGISPEDLESVQQLSLVGMYPLDLNIEYGIRIDIDLHVLSDVGG